MLSLSGSEITIFSSILNIELIIIIGILLIRGVNILYLGSNWREMLIYPIKPSSFLLSKCFHIYLLSMTIVISTIIPLFVYGMISDTGIYYYLYLVLYKVIIAALLVVYFVLITLTIFWIISCVKSSRNSNKGDKLIILVDLLVVLLTYFMLNINSNGKFSFNDFLLNNFFNGNPNPLTASEGGAILVSLIIALVMVVVGFLGIYFIGGSVYLKIMKSGMFDSKDYKKIETNISNYEFNLRSPIVSNIIREIKLILRNSSLLYNYIIVYAIFTLVLTIILLLFSQKIILFGRELDGIKGAVITLWFLSLSIASAISITSYSREGRALRLFNAFPIESKKILLSKILVRVLVSMIAFISSSILTILLSSSLVEFILLEVVLIVYMLGIVIIHIGKDLSSMELKWIDIKDLITVKYTKILKPYFIMTILPMGFIVFLRIIDIEITEYVASSFLIIIIVIYSLLGFKSIKKNMA